MHRVLCPVTATATNVANITLDSPGSGSLQVGPAAFNIFFHFCTPSEPTERSKTVQILAHGEYWNVQYKPEVYSYERAALAQGYSILSYDALGSGRTFEVVHLAPPHIALPDFDKIVYMGHSLGS
ncbi:hypothetical protein BKA62DRAFT_769417 [Auriculariales sp. MPI-PUGE-AT-0066]|nr:hypothetical protein BKA62DRAFT_769417 [Auriculariales sp. MPI-PUGE-AT-0066]